MWDFKLTVNTASKLDRYTIPKIDDLVTTLAGGEKFTKLDEPSIFAVDAQ